jgi:hypothetical protein
MSFIRGLLDRVVLVGGVLLGGVTPSFVAQYRQRVGGHLNQVLNDLAPFQEIANRFHQGSLETLVQYHLNSTDATFHQEGVAIKAMMDSAQRLKQAFDSLSGDIFHQLWFLSRNADPNILQATWAIYQPSFVLSVDSMIFAAFVGVTLWLLFLAGWGFVTALVSHVRRT